MNSWIDLHALWRIIVVGALCGAGLPALFAVGLKALAYGTPAEPATAHGGSTAGTVTSTRPSPLGLIIAGLCFAVILAAVAWGIYLIVNGS